MELYIHKLQAELKEILKEAKPEDLRLFFRPTENIDELVVKCILWGALFPPALF